uniref:Uncharacterized protein n=1 Tax=Oryza punctata TaxID=4537 RepID=A0A0E0LYG5_ORYPU
MWDNRMGTLLDRFDEHDGPVRGVHFHATQPLFVSGGDDYKIKVWNYKTHRCLFTLHGHLDYIRTVQFRHEYPWIVSASDDQTIRIWNWQSRTCVAVLTGHKHYVMCVSFHPKEDLVVSASLDQTVRVWDIGALRKKAVSPVDDILRLTQMNTDLFGGVDAVVKYVLEGYDRGVNWASFHSTLPLIVSGADDRQVKLWRMNDTKAWEVDTLRGHMNNVSCVMFHAKQDIIVSNSEDKSIRVWDATKQTGIQTFRREHYRFWILAAHPEMNLLAAGHDNGMIVFKLERECAAFSVSGDTVFYVKDRFLRFFEYSTQKEVQLAPIRRPGSVSLNQSPRTLSYSPTENAILICSDVDGGSYELYVVPKDSAGRTDYLQEAKKGAGGSAVFVARNRFAVLEKSRNQVLVKNLKNEIVKKSPLMQFIMLGLQRLILGKLQAPAVKYVVWSRDMESVALLSKHAVVIANKKLVHRCTLHETIRVKSGAWDENDHDGKNKLITVDASEYIFKLALLRKRYDHVMSMIKNSQLCGQAVISYWQQKGFPEVALHFVKDEKTRFNLALENGNIQIAVASAKEIDDKDHWYWLGIEALRQGNVGIVEYAYQRAKNFERLAFLYLITGYMDKNNDLMGQFHNALYPCDATKRVEILENAGQLPLAYITAATHGLTEIADRLAAELDENVPSLPEGKARSLLIPPAPLTASGDWPLLRVMRGIFEGGLDATGKAELEEDDEAAGADWGDEDLDMVDASKAMANGGDGFDAEEGEANEEDGEEGIPVSQIWTQKSSLAGEHAAAGNFDTAMRLLSRQLGIKNFAPLKPLLLDLHMGSHSYLHALATAPIIPVAVEKGWSESASPNVRGPPALVSTFSQMKDRLKVAYKATTEEHFARMLLENNPNEGQAKRARQVQQQCSGKKDTCELNYDYRNPFVVCGATYVPIYRGQKDVSCPYCGSRFVPSIERQFCTICELAVVGADASGLLCSPTQLR